MHPPTPDPARAVQPLDGTSAFPEHAPPPGAPECPKEVVPPRPKARATLWKAIPAYVRHLGAGPAPRLALDPRTAAALRRWEDRWGRRPLGSIESADLDRYLDGLEPFGLSARDIAIERRLLRSFFRWARREGWTDSDPTSGLELDGARRDGGAVAWTASEQYLLLEGCQGRFPSGAVEPCDEAPLGTAPGAAPGAASVARYLHPLVILGLRTGLSIDDLLRLRWRHVDLHERRIQIPATERSAPRDVDVPIGQEVVSVLTRIVRGADGYPWPEQLVLESMDLPMWEGQPCVREILHAFRMVRKRTGVREGDFCSLRASFLRNCAKAGVPPMDAARLCDWTSPEGASEPMGSPSPRVRGRLGA